jgi:uncharacterized membrane protein
MLLCKHGVLKRLSGSADVDGAEAVCWTALLGYLHMQSENVSMLQSATFGVLFFLLQTFEHSSERKLVFCTVHTHEQVKAVCCWVNEGKSFACDVFRKV